MGSDISVSWQVLKDFMTTNSLTCQWFIVDDKYYIYAFKGMLSLNCAIKIENPANANQTDFETNFKSSGNQSLIVPMKIESSTPFADPLYRTKHNATALPVSIANNSSQVIDYILGEELYCSGGSLLVKNAKWGDWVTAEIHDPLAVIPEPFRAATCENWPTVATYIAKQHLELYDSTSVWFKQGVDTRPLVAKISAGLSLRVTYHAIDDVSGDTREVLVNYFLNKKL